MTAFPANAQWVEIRNGTQPLTRINRSAAAPSVTVVTPNGGESYGAAQTVTIAWSATDADSAVLRSSVYYSPDNPGAEAAQCRETKKSALVREFKSRQPDVASVGEFLQICRTAAFKGGKLGAALFGWGRHQRKCGIGLKQPGEACSSRSQIAVQAGLGAPVSRRPAETDLARSMPAPGELDDLLNPARFSHTPRNQFRLEVGAKSRKACGETKSVAHSASRRD